MNNSPLVSIIMPAFNAAQFLPESIASVQQQTYKNWELIIIDDGSTDHTFKLAEEFHWQDSRIRLIPLPVNQGAGFARNIGIKASEGDYICFLDADDLWKPHKLETQLDFMHSNNLQVSFSSYELINEDGKSQDYRIRALNSLGLTKLLKANYIGNLTGMYDVQKLGKVYCPLIRKRQDWAMWITAVQRAGRAMGIQESLAIYRIRENSISGNKWEMLQYNFNVYRKVLGFSTPKSAYYIIQFLGEQFFVKSRQKEQLKQ